MWSRKKGKKKKYKISMLIKAMLKPILFALLPVLDAMLEAWKIQLLDQIPKISTKELKGFLSDQIDNVRLSIGKQIKKSLEE